MTGYKFIPLTKGKWTLIDASDYRDVSQYKWHADAGYGMQYYAKRRKNKRAFPLASHLMNPPPGMVVDHINRNPLDNRRCNLRVATKSQNIANSARVGRSGIKGVHPHSGGWHVSSGLNGRNVYIGWFKKVEDAISAREAFVKEKYGEFAFLNKRKSEKK